jgi:hypothetical protein
MKILIAYICMVVQLATWNLICVNAAKELNAAKMMIVKMIFSALEICVHKHILNDSKF